MTYISKFTKIDDSKRTATIKKLFVGITDRDELYFLEVGDRGSQDFTISGDTVMKVSESSAEEYTKDRIRDYFEMDEGLSNINVLNYLDDSAESFFDDYQEESNRNYAEDIAGESADGYPNRLAEELVERGIVDEEDAQKDDFDAEDYIDEFVEDMNNQEDSIEWYRFNFGEEEFAEVVRNNNLIDIDEVVDDVDWYDWFDNSTLTDEVLSDDGETFLFEALGGGQNRDELDNLKITFLPESFINQLKKNWDKYHLKQLPKSEFFPEVEQDEQGILDFYVNEALDVYEAGGTLPTPFGQAGLVGETGAMNEMDLFAMGGTLPQSVHQYYAQTYNPVYPTPHGYAKGGEVEGGTFDLSMKEKSEMYKYLDKGDFTEEKFMKKFGKNEPQTADIIYYWAESRGLNTPQSKRLHKAQMKQMGYAKGGKTQGYNDKLDESLGNTKGKRSTKEQNYKDRRNESEAMEKKGGKRKYARVKTMDKGNRKKRKTPMTLAKAIRRDGEKWQDAVKRATIMMKKDK